MRANELRIGNWVNSQFGGIQQVVDVMCDGVNTLKYEGINYEFINPIPLTEEWLVKFGFELTAYGYKRKGWAICLIKQENGYLVSSYSRNITLGVKYVHTLQNLYFALTGEELTLKNEDK